MPPCLGFEPSWPPDSLHRRVKHSWRHPFQRRQPQARLCTHSQTYFNCPHLRLCRSACRYICHKFIPFRLLTRHITFIRGFRKLCSLLLQLTFLSGSFFKLPPTGFKTFNLDIGSIKSSQTFSHAPSPPSLICNFKRICRVRPDWIQTNVVESSPPGLRSPTKSLKLDAT